MLIATLKKKINEEKKQFLSLMITSRESTTTLLNRQDIYITCKLLNVYRHVFANHKLEKIWKFKEWTASEITF